jgi:septal ring factor EnvC (AmiA/AmiB activator)
MVNELRWLYKTMEARIHFPRISKTLLMLLIGLLAASNSWSQTATPPSPTKLYMEEIGRLKQQKTALTEENEALKQALQAEKQKSVQLQSSLDKVQPSITERDRQLADLKTSLNTANQRISRQELLAALLAWVIVFLLMGLLAYSQRVALRKMLRKLMERRPGTGRNSTQQPQQSSGRLDDGAIRPEELVERLYGRRHV